MSNTSQLLLLADHIKLSLLERQRAQSLKLERNQAQELNIIRSLDSLREGIETLASQSPEDESLEDIRSQYHDLSKQFHGESSSTATEILSTPNNPALEEDFAQAQSRVTGEQSQNTGRSTARSKDTSAAAKNVRFRDNPSDEEVDVQDEANRAALFQERYTDEDRAQPPDPTENMSNQQVHEYHQQIMQDQDDQLDRLGESIGRQRHLSMQIGDELEGQIALLDEVEAGVDRHQGRLDGARRRLNKVGQKAKANWGMTTIIILIVILVLLIVVLK